MNLSGFENHNISILSPDSKRLLVSHPKMNGPDILDINILSSNGEIERKVLSLPKSDDHILRYFNWVNNSSILSYIQINGSQLYGLFNPITPRWHPIELRALSLYAYSDNRVSGIALSPDLSRILFVDNYSNLVLYNLEENKKLWEDTEYDRISPTMQSVMLQPSIWAEDGSMLAIPISQQKNNAEEYKIIILDKNGQLLRSFLLNDRPGGLNFSHNNKYLLFFANHLITSDNRVKDIPIIKLFNYDTAQVTDLCIMDTDTSPVHNIEAGKILWSPDDKYIAYNYGNAPPLRNVKNGIVIQKLDSEQIRLIPSEDHNYILLGWSPYQWASSEKTKTPLSSPLR